MLISSNFDTLENDVADVDIRRLRARSMPPYEEVIREGVKSNECLVGSVKNLCNERDLAMEQYHERHGDLFSPSEAQEGSPELVVTGETKVIRNVDQFHAN